MIIAVDGPTASGKGTLAKALAAHFGLPFLDTGLLYRAVGRQVQINNGNPDNPADALAGCDFPDSILDDAALRTETVGGLASRVSLHPQVRAALNKRQVDFANQPSGALLDGRDIGTVIAPHADVKLFVTAPAEVRAQRRYDEMQRHGIDVRFADILADIHARDARDMGRADAPLKPAQDALLLDTGDLTIGGAVQAAIALVESRLRKS
ncbi:MAG: cytidylate kinase [Sphingomonadales bacterium 35-56-22]|uniref:(d)CMP kinase n=1 Tax=Sphingorhabdus sp. TaxID=1902408 RepID=UPI000BD7FFF8|nr:d(CMP) kinase [Sphingorhabdus sp.]OYY14586.1 MAG: cytidylate kinase [Sphingomonadales bacterium 35-56-22]OYY97878.1 MAG: cytidylate kinase [Sphingomonadales bacterium 28-56-43]OYZ61252.1 MAG: cytidylate kinase [Sphingomonadales bacterium 24-56-14]OZA83105.1 MAG: cytidylate kinase [Sphingomonadales bacterium 39-57-19]HQS12532.1 d(CMP) kinase [Sphingorhabdus sp.]